MLELDTEIINEVESDEVRLDSFAVKDKLNGKLWDGDRLKPNVRRALLDMAWDFVDTLAVPWVKPKDIVFTGSLANYNWSEYSDIDLHVVVDFSKVWNRRKEFVKDYFSAKKNEWSDSHESLKIYGYPVEISVEDSGEPSKSSGVFSLEDNKWVSEPEDLSDARLNTTYIKDTAAKYMTDIDDEIRRIRRSKSDAPKKKSCDNLIKIFDRLKNLRKSGLSSKAREMSSGNIIWKVLRREGYLDKLWDWVNKTYDSVNSIR